MARYIKNPRRLSAAIVLILALMILRLEWYLGEKYAEERSTDFRAFEWDAKTFFRLKPGYKGVAFRSDIHINEAGFRGGEETRLQTDRALRILTLGDSRAYGFAVKDEETFSHVLQTSLRDRGIDAEVLNAGTHGYSAVQCRAKLEELLPYKPDVAIFAPGFNDRRYLLLTPPDSTDYFQRIVTVRCTLDLLEKSNSIFALMHTLRARRLHTLMHHPPGLDGAKVRVDEETFEEELVRYVEICRSNRIQPILLALRQNPQAFAPVEEAQRVMDEGRYRDVIDSLESRCDNLDNNARAYGHYLLGQCYRALGEDIQAQRHFHAHKPLGSLYGESVLRSETAYFRRFENVSHVYHVPLLDSQEVINRVNEYRSDPEILKALIDYRDYQYRDRNDLKIDTDGRVENAEEFYKFTFVDESHYDALGERLIGLGLVDAVGLVTSSGG